MVASFGFLLWIFVGSSSLVDARLEEARNRVPTRVYSRPVSVRTSDHMTVEGLVSILNALSYQVTLNPDPGPGEFALAEKQITLRPRHVDPTSLQGNEPMVVGFDHTRTAGDIVKSIKTTRTGRDLQALTLEPALISYLFEGEEREKRRFVKYDELPKHLVEAVLAIEDRQGKLEPLRIDHEAENRQVEEHAIAGTRAR